VRRFRRGLDRFLGGARPIVTDSSVSDVLPDRAAEERRLLRNDADRAAQFLS
jgi:hypothetical protein